MALTPDTAAEHFFARVDMNGKLGLDSPTALWNWALNGGSSALKGRQPLPTGSQVVYRGQAKAGYGLTSSLYRLCRRALPGGVGEKRLAEVETMVINAMREEGIGRRMSDGQLLSVLQHHGVPTRLIDFSSEALEALYFAVENYDTVDGRLFVVSAHGRNRSLTIDLDFSPHGDRQLRWSDHARGDKYAADAWTQTVALVDPKDLDPRMIAQRGVFLVGGLNRRSAGRSMRVKVAGQSRPVELERSLYPDVTTLGINFVTTVRNPHQSWPATGWTIRIPGSWKPELRKHLETVSDSIRRDTMYPPVDEVWRLANYAVLENLTRGSRG